MAIVALIVLQEERELGFVTRFCVSDLHGGSSNTLAGGGKDRQNPGN
jgi:hypothetical protein